MFDCSVWWRIALLYFFSCNCTCFEQNESIKVQNFRLLTAHVKSHDSCTFIGPLKYKILAKKYRGVISYDPEYWCKTWRKTDLLFQKWQEFGEIWPEHSKVSKTCTFICSYCAKYVMFDLKNTEELSFMTLKGDAKFEEKLTCGLENDMRNMANFHQSNWKSQNWHIDGILLSKVGKVWA